MKADCLADLIARCREHADYLDDVGNDGDGEDVRELIREVSRTTLGWHEEMRQAAEARREVDDE